MGKPKTKKWDKIGKITEEWVKASYSNADVVSAWKYKDRMNTFLEFLGMNDSEFVEGYKRAKDRNEWAKSIGLKAVAFYNERIRQDYATNTARAEVSTIRAFCRDNCTTLLLPRKKIAKAKEAHGEHEFSREELSKMFYVGDVRSKAILSTAISLGFAVEDFSELPRQLIESLAKKATEEKIDFIGFDYERGKTGVSSRSHLTPEARDSLKAWFEYSDKKRESEGKPKSEWVWSNGNGSHLSEQAINDIIKDLVQKANVTTTGTIRFHLIRKFLTSALHHAGFTDWEVKRAVGKEIPTSDGTYLHGLNNDIDLKFPQVYDGIQLNGSGSKNHLRIEELEQKIQQLEINQENLAIENQTLRRIIEYSIPKDKVQDAIMKLAKEHGVTIAKESGEMLTLEELIKVLRTTEKKIEIIKDAGFETHIGD